MRNVIFIGERGSGKSSIINLVAGHDYAAVSPDTTPCTNHFTTYGVSLWERTYRLWDTPGFNGTRGSQSFWWPTRTTGSLTRFLQERKSHKELDLLVLCVRRGRALQSMSRIYKIFCSATRRIAIPVVIAVTHLEKVEPTMEAWWQDNERKLTNLGMVFDGYACLTCLSPHHRRRASQEVIRNLISREYPQRTWSTLGEQKYLDDSDSACTIC